MITPRSRNHHSIVPAGIVCLSRPGERSAEVNPLLLNKLLLPLSLSPSIKNHGSTYNGEPNRLRRDWRSLRTPLFQS
ncbi:hypothetical protein D3C78_631870 [compost metagenome]